MKRGRKPRYVHLLRAMRAGDTIYFSEHTTRLDKAFQATVYRGGGRCTTACFVATNLDPAEAHRVVAVTMLKPMKKGTKL
jgi:hypothetical protein